MLEAMNHAAAPGRCGSRFNCDVSACLQGRCLEKAAARVDAAFSAHEYRHSRPTNTSDSDQGPVICLQYAYTLRDLHPGQRTPFAEVPTLPATCQAAAIGESSLLCMRYVKMRTMQAGLHTP